MREYIINANCDFSRRVQLLERNYYCAMIDSVHVPYSGNFSRMKTFANFTVSRQFAKVSTVKIFIEYRGVIINVRVIVVSHNSQKF